MNSLRNRKNALPLVSCIDNLWTFNWVMPQILWLQILAWFLPAIEITAWSLHHVPFHFILFSSPTSFLTLHLLSISWNILVATRIPNNRKWSLTATQIYPCSLSFLLHMSIGLLFHWKYKQDQFQGYAKHKTWAMTAACAAGRKGMLFTALLCISTALSAGACVSVCTGKSNASKQCYPQKKKVHYWCNTAFKPQVWKVSSKIMVQC